MKQCTFNEKNYNSGDGMLTSVWGPNMWHVLHTISFNYPVNPTEKDKKRYMTFVKSLTHVLPCKYCRINLKKNLKSLHLNKSVMKNRDTFSRWVYKLHNHVNTMLNKKNNVTFEEIRDRYEHFRARCSQDGGKRKKIKKSKKLKKQKKVKKVKKVKSKKIQRGGKEKGCTSSLYGVKSMSVINIIPRRKGIKTLKIDPRCKYKRV